MQNCLKDHLLKVIVHVFADAFLVTPLSKCEVHAKASVICIQRVNLSAHCFTWQLIF